MLGFHSVTHVSVAAVTQVDGKVYYRNRSWIMLLSDFLMKEDAGFLPFVQLYKEDQVCALRHDLCCATGLSHTVVCSLL